jgi:hypothetical protein
MTPVCREYRHSLRANRTLSNAGARRDLTTGKQRPGTLPDQFRSEIDALLYALTPATTIHVHPSGASARLTHLKQARTALISTSSTAIASLAVLLISDQPAIYLPAALLLMFSAAVAGVSIASLRLAAAIPSYGDVLLTDLVRHPDGRSGAGANLIDEISRSAHRIIGTAANPDLWTKVYDGRATKLDFSTNGKVHFVLDRTGTAP